MKKITLLLLLSVACSASIVLFSCDNNEIPERKVFNEDLSLVPEDNTIVGSWLFSETLSEQCIIEVKEKTTTIMPMRLTAMNKGENLNFLVNHQNMWDLNGCTFENRFIRILNDCSISLSIKFDFSALSSKATIVLMKGSSSISGDLFWKNNSIDNNATEVDLTYDLVGLKKDDLLYFTIKVDGVGGGSHKVRLFNSRIVATEI